MLARYLIVAHQTSASAELIAHLRELQAQHTDAEFVLLVPATPVANLLVWEEGESSQIAGARATASRRKLEAAGIRVAAVRVGDYSPVDAVIDEVRTNPGYDAVVVSTFPPNMSRWLKMDLPSQIARSLPHTRVEHVIAQPVIGEPVRQQGFAARQ